MVAQDEILGKFEVAIVPEERLNKQMAHVSLHYHCIFSTKDRLPIITPHIRERLWEYMGGIARKNDMLALEIGGVADHVHILLEIHQTESIAHAMQLIKAGSSKWVHDTFHVHRDFEWQQKYAAFTVSTSQLGDVSKYIKNQAAHHEKVSFQDEYLEFLKKNNVKYDERYLWG